MASLPAPPADASGPVFQSLPFKTDFHGVSDIEANFTSHTSTTTEGGRVLRHNRFRGRTLTGVDVAIPSGYEMAVIDCASGGSSAGGGRLQPPLKEGLVCADELQLVASSATYTLWEHDRAPDRAADALEQWIAIAQVLHSDE